MLLVNDSKFGVLIRLFYNAQLQGNTYSPSGRLLSFNIYELILINYVLYTVIRFSPIRSDLHYNKIAL